MVRFRRAEGGEQLGTWLAIVAFFAVDIAIGAKFGLLIAFLVGWLPSALIAVGVAHGVKAVWMALFARPQRLVPRIY
jgi:hypothetical protein